MDSPGSDVKKSINPVISVVIPCYNQGKFLEESIESVLNQTFKDYEIIVVDDGSTEPATKEILASLAEKHPEIKFIHQENKGLAGARNSGVKAALGEYFLPLDGDDKIEPIMLEKCIEVLKSDASLGFAFTSVRYFGDYDAIWHPREYNFFDLLKTNQFTSCALVRKKAWEDAGGYDEKMLGGYEDWEFWINLGKHGWYGKKIGEPLFNYRRHLLSMTDDARERHQKNIAFIKEKHAELFTEDAQKEMKNRWGSLVEEERKSKKTILGRLHSIKKKLELAGALSLRSWARHPLRTFYRAIPIRWKTGGFVKRKR